MTLAVMQPYFLPYFGYFQLAMAVDAFVLYDDVNYINRGWVNRNRILIGGNPSFITIPLLKSSQNKKINEIQVDPDLKWRNKMQKSVEMAYKKAPLFEVVFPLFQKIILNDSENISDFNKYSFTSILEYLGIQTPIKESSVAYNNDHLSGQMRILDICVQEKAKRYINPIGGMELYDQNIFLEKGIDLKFIQSNSVEYKQFNASFVSHLSILDLLMFVSKEKIMSDFINNFKLIENG